LFSDTTAEVSSFEYDALGRLTKAIYPDGETEEYSYDKDGNRLSLNSHVYGNIEYMYNDIGELTGMKVGSDEVTFGYDGDGNMVLSVNGERLTGC